MYMYKLLNSKKCLTGDTFFFSPVGVLQGLATRVPIPRDAAHSLIGLPCSGEILTVLATLFPPVSSNQIPSTSVTQSDPVRQCRPIRSLARKCRSIRYHSQVHGVFPPLFIPEADRSAPVQLISS
jgi:hypothetical protein